MEPTVTDGVAGGRRSGQGHARQPGRQPRGHAGLPAASSHRGFTLLVDGTGAVDGDDVRVTPTGAVLHRPAGHADGPPAPDGCGHDCAPVA